MESCLVDKLARYTSHITRLLLLVKIIINRKSINNLEFITFLSVEAEQISKSIIQEHCGVWTVQSALSAVQQ